MRTPHKHAEIIKAWADGAAVQCRNSVDREWRNIGYQPCWFEDIEYRIKPEPKPDIVVTRRADVVYAPSFAKPAGNLVFKVSTEPNVRFVFDGDTHQLKSVSLEQ